MDENGILYGLRCLGQEVVTCNLQLLPPLKRVAAWHRAWSEVHPDLIFCYGYWDTRFTPEDLKPPIGFRPVPFVYWASDDPIYMYFSSLPMLTRADLILTTTEECIPVYQRSGCRAGLLQFGCNPNLHRPAEPTELHQFVLIANNYGRTGTTSFRLRCNRDILMPIVERGYDIKIWGLWWTDSQRPCSIPPLLYGGSLPYEQLAEIYSGAEIVLGMQFHHLSRTQTSCRVFETLACRAFYLGPYTNGTVTYFEHGKHLVLSNSAEETLELASYYLDHPLERARIAAAGQKEVYNKHTYEHRAREFLAEVEKL